MGETPNNDVRLRMARNTLRDLPPVVEPEGIEIRTYQPGDEAAWAEIMNTGVGEGWTVEKVAEELVQKPQFDPKGLFFAVMNGRCVGSACAWRIPPEETATGIVHMVCVLPECRGRNLGYLLVLRVLHYFADHGFERTVLSTDGYRIPAVKSYLRLGFEPDIVEDADRDYWARMLPQLRR